MKSKPQTLSISASRLTIQPGRRISASSIAVLAGRQVERSTLPVDALGGRIQRQLGDADVRLLGRRVAAQQRPDPRQQLAERERLDEVVVGAGVQPVDPVADGVAGGQHQDRGPDAVRPQLRQTSKPSSFGSITSSTITS